MKLSPVVLSVVLAFFLAGCATVIRTNPVSGIGSTAQKGVSTALEQNLALDRRLVEGKKVSLVVETLGTAPLSSAIGHYARSVVREEIEEAGGEVVLRGEDLSIVARIDAAGVASISRTLNLRLGTHLSLPFWYSEKMEGKSHVTLIYRDAEGRPLRAVVNQAEIPHEDIYLFYFFGLPKPP